MLLLPDGIVQSAFSYSGQKCSACSRVYAKEDIRDKLFTKLEQKTEALPGRRSIVYQYYNKKHFY